MAFLNAYYLNMVALDAGWPNDFILYVIYYVLHTVPVYLQTPQI